MHHVRRGGLAVRVGMAALPVTHIRWFARVHTTGGTFGTTNASVSSTHTRR